MDSYVNALLLQAEDFSVQCKNHYVNSIFIGGGTPTVLKPKQLIRIIDCITKFYKIDRSMEITVEVNPATVTVDDLKKLFKAGVNRLSIGMQSAINSELREIGRIHTYEEFERTYNAARFVGFENINVDVMYGIPGQTRESFSKTLDKLISLEPDHVSLYALKIEEGTPLHKLQDKYVFPSEDDQYGMYMEAVQKLRKSYVYPYEISNFARSGYESAHNLKYWLGEEYVGLGVAAHSYLNGERFGATKNLKTYIYAMTYVKKKIPIYVSYEEIGEREAAKEFFLLNMRLYQGIDIKDFAREFGIEVAKMYLEPLRKYVEHGYVSIKGDIYSFTEKGMLVSSYIKTEVLAEVDKILEESGENTSNETAESSSDADSFI
jgi:oxygen-independent coproporphyrinogen-3 oxidase